MRDSWVRQLIDVCLSENQRPYFCFLHVRQKIDTIRHDTPQRAHTSNTINDNCINLIRDNWSRVYSLGSFFYYHCFVFYLLLVLKSIYFSAIISLLFDMLCSLIRSIINWNYFWYCWLFVTSRGGLRSDHAIDISLTRRSFWLNRPSYLNRKLRSITGLAVSILISYINTLPLLLAKFE